MHTAIDALMTKVLDYAGLFPPAKLPLDVALSAYLTAKASSPHRWMLGRFVCPTARLGELLPLAQAHPHGALLSIAALGQAASTADAMLPVLTDDVKRIEEFRRTWGSNAVIDMYEVTLPKNALPPSGFADILARANLRGFVEVPASASWRADFDALTDAMENSPRPLGMKLRCGGLTSEAFPSDDLVAYFIERCSLYQLTWKATAGLHHPRRHWDSAIGVWHHGFLNVVVAGILASLHLLEKPDITEILADQDCSGIHIDENRITWREWSATAEQIRKQRQYHVTTFGSCSFDEPCQDLLTMGLLQAP